MGRRKVDLTGQRFNYLKVIRRMDNRNTAIYECICDCGNKLNVSHSNLKKGQKSCGCYSRELFKSDEWSKLNSSHGFYNHELYQTWNSMLRRCNDKNNSDYKNYGARGIKVCDRWNVDTPEFFIQDIEDKLGKKPKNHTLDRIDNNGDYEISNVKWSSKSEQTSNQRKKLGQSGERFITKRRDGMYIVSFTRDKHKIFSNAIKSLNRAIFIREYYLDLYSSNNKEQWEEICNKRTYIRK